MTNDYSYHNPPEPREEKPDMSDEKFEKAREQKFAEQTAREYEYVSECCSARPKGNGDCDTADFGICSSCRDQCEYGYFAEDGTFFAKESEAQQHDNK